MKEIKALHVLGCVPTLLNYLFEIAEESGSYTTFNVYKNIPCDLDGKLEVFKHWDVKFFDSFDFDKNNIIKEGDFALSVVGSKSKKIVYEYFKKLFDLKKENFVKLIHPTSCVSRSAKIGNAALIGQLCIIANNSQIGFAVNIKMFSTIGNHCVIHDYVEINQGVSIGGLVTIGEGTLIGMSSSIRDGIKIGKNCIIGMGSVVVRDIPDNSFAVGVPCRVIKKNI